ncbi:MAG TPA: hypothetical protein DEQ26_07990, partial [Flavobacteriaceae bacterium]|nr:hypothetical protein [Flavobacteriaceae bacterium]
QFFKIIPLVILSFLSFISSTKAQSKSENYILVREFIEATTDTAKSSLLEKKRIDNITYFDALGRESTKIINPKNDVAIASKITYDAFGRVDKEYIPGLVPNINLPNSINYSDYPENSNHYAQKIYDSSPLNRVQKQGAPGKDWDVNGLNIKQEEYLINNNDNVLFFSFNHANFELYPVHYFSNGTLSKIVTKDENGQPSIIFKDDRNRVILKRLQSNGKNFDTYYLYDIYGNISFIFPPKLIEIAKNNVTEYISNLDNLAYQYRYDKKGRLIEKKLPGKEWEYMLYDNQDRLVGLRDHMMFEKANNEKFWIFTKYDRFNRVAITGKIWTNDSRENLQNYINTLGNNNVNRSSGYEQDNLQIYYDTAGFGANNHILTINYYDDYPVIHKSVNQSGQIFNHTIASGEKLKGLPTLSVSRSLEAKLNDRWSFEYDYTFYDDKDLHAIKNHKINYLGGSTIIENQLDFRGKILQVLTTHRRLEADSSIIIRENFTYNNFENVIKHTHQINDGKVEVLYQNTFNNIGQLTTKKVGNSESNPYQQIDYKYNIRGWLTQINDVTNLNSDLFAFKINYNTLDDTKANVNTRKLFNGNISQTLWTSQENSYLRSYDYLYDGLNRLNNSSYSNLSRDFRGSYDENITYDENGNISSLKRYGVLEQATPVLIDNLTYTYKNSNKSNQLLKVDDSSNNLGFNDVNKGDDYTYDNNGNLLTDLNKGISIEYNHLDLPIKIIKNNQSIEYAYDATGNKLKKTVNDGTKIVTTDYLDGFQYQNNTLQFFPTPEGYVNVITCTTCPIGSNRTYNYVYNFVDHLGNIRVSYAWDEAENKLKTINEDHYYAFGLKHSGYKKPPKVLDLNENGLIDIKIRALPGGGNISGSTNYKYEYNGKELQDELGINLYDYGARNYDPAIGRWFNIDPLAEETYSISPYTYALNNPVYFIDPNGMSADDPDNKGYFDSPDTDQLKGEVDGAFVKSEELPNSYDLDSTQAVLDILGSTEIPIVSQLADIGSAGISLYNGDYLGAGLSLAGTIIPGLSQAKLGLAAIPIVVKVGKSAKSGLKKFSKNVNADIILEKQLAGKGQLRNLRKNPNLEGIGIDDLLKKTPSEIEEMYKGSENGNKIIKQLNKAFEGRDLGKGH